VLGNTGPSHGKEDGCAFIIAWIRLVQQRYNINA